MTVVAHTNVHGKNDAVKTISSLQTALSLPVNRDVDHQAMASKIIAMQVALGSSKAPVCKYIDNERIAEKLMQLENAINNP